MEAQKNRKGMYLQINLKLCLFLGILGRIRKKVHGCEINGTSKQHCQPVSLYRGKYSCSFFNLI